MKVSELSGAQLDYWVAKAAGLIVGGGGDIQPFTSAGPYAPSGRWDQGGPIIEREGIWLSDDGDEEIGPWIASCQPHANEAIYEGATPLEAAMRSYVASKFGEEVNE